MHYQGFERLVKKMDEIAGRTDEEIVMQIGSSSYQPKKAEFFPFIDDDREILELCKKARVIVSHCGAGSILTALALRKPLIIVPRLKRYGEHIDDQQLELAEALLARRGIKVINDIEGLEAALSESGSLEQCERAEVDSRRAKLVDFLRDYLGGFEK
jgi:UDP-N-acetylglucosamine transferase subunit ALG13